MAPQTLADTRSRLHLVAARVLAAARYQAVGKLGLEVAPGGFATPEFDGRRLSVTEGALSDGHRRLELTLLGAACEFAGVDITAAVHPVLALAGVWPEHFDVALEAGPEASRATYGGSPGDGEIAEPYLYVGPLVPRVGEFWNASFGAALTRTEVNAGADPLEFFVAGLKNLSQSPS
jgi:hypothetical protein